MTNETTLNREVILERIINAPRELVFKAFTDRNQLAAWWGPACYTNPVCEIDPVPGGAIKIHMCGPDGAIYPMGGHFEELLEPERLVFTSRAFIDDKGEAQMEARNTVTFEDDKGKTKLRLHIVILKVSPAVAGAVSGMEEGWSQSLVKLAAEIKSSSIPFVIERTFQASPAAVWKAITDKDAMKQWYFDLAEFRPEVGFEFSFTGCGSDSTEYVHHCRITEVVPGRKLVHTWRYEGIEGDSEVTFELIPAGDQTTVKLTHKGLETFRASSSDFEKSSFAGGWAHILGISLKQYLEQNGMQ